MKRLTVALLTLWFVSAISLPAQALCPLCKAKAESSVGKDREQAKGLNAGILYLLVMPYLLAGGIGYWWYVNQQKRKKLADDVYE